LPTFSFLHQFKNGARNQLVNKSWHVINYLQLEKNLKVVNWNNLHSDDIKTLYNNFLKKLNECADDCRIEH